VAQAVASPELLGVTVPNDAVAMPDALVVSLPKAVAEASPVGDFELTGDGDTDGLLDVDREMRAETLVETLLVVVFDAMGDAVEDFETRAVTDGEPETVGVELVDVEIDVEGDNDELAESELSSDTDGSGLLEELPLPTSDSEASGDMEADTVGDREENNEFD